MVRSSDQLKDQVASLILLASQLKANISYLEVRTAFSESGITTKGYAIFQVKVTLEPSTSSEYLLINEG